MHVQKGVWVTLFLPQLSQEGSKFKVATGTLSLVSACLLQADWPVNEQQKTPVCPCSRGQQIRPSLLDIAPAKADRTAEGASTPTMHFRCVPHGISKLRVHLKDYPSRVIPKHFYQHTVEIVAYFWP